MSPRSRSDVLRQMAKDRAVTIKSGQSPILSEAEQLRIYNERVSQGGQFFKDLIDQGKVSDAGRYISAMEKLQRKHGGGT